LDLKWTSRPAATEFGPCVDLTRRSAVMEFRLLLRARSTWPFECRRSTTAFDFLIRTDPTSSTGAKRQHALLTGLWSVTDAVRRGAYHL
jgi:hypothetical protein